MYRNRCEVSTSTSSARKWPSANCTRRRSPERSVVGSQSPRSGTVATTAGTPPPPATTPSSACAVDQSRNARGGHGEEEGLRVVPVARCRGLRSVLAVRRGRPRWGDGALHPDRDHPGEQGEPRDGDGDAATVRPPGHDYLQCG